MSSFKTIVLFFSVILISAVLLFGIRQTAYQLDSMVAEHNLRFTGQINNAPPLVVFTTVALGSFRGLLADFLWFRAASLQDKGNYYEMVQLANWITKLQPHFSGATAYLAWNMAYNISVTCSSPADRWRWVQAGIELLRDEALVYNPEDASLYKELGWIFQHKLGNILDDAHLYYKNMLAIRVMEVIGAKPDWSKMAVAPIGKNAFIEKYHPEDYPRLQDVMNKSGFPDYDSLYREFKKESKLPDNFLKELNSEALAREFDIAFRATWLKEKFKLDAALIHRINEKYGELDWRIAESQAIYWATKGLEMTLDGRDLSCERMITQALFASFKSGRLLMIDEDKFESIVSVPNLQVVDAVKRTYEEAYLANEKQSSFRSAMLNFMQDAVVILYNYGSFSKAAEYYDMLRKEEPGKYLRPLENYVMRAWAEDVRDASVKKATDVISGLVYRSLYYMIYGDQDAALANERIARYIYANYQRANVDIKQRVGLAPYGKIKEGVVNNCLKTFPPMMVEILRAKLKDEEQRKAAEAVPAEK